MSQIELIQQGEDFKSKPIFPYPGGKTKLANNILPLIPDHKKSRELIITNY
ncbi:hypothetical protein [Taylorella asinigenitalis]|uniref:hypothetical protein n=1 Tax=Taylorella asinigenitalis TaxID=84590 RepID=UPI000ADD42D3|nr:hypothetical protein [Taylorella asinigenitalis]